MIWVSRIDLFQLVPPNGNKKTIALPYRFGIEKTAQIFLSESGRCQAIVSLFRNYRLSGIKNAYFDTIHPYQSKRFFVKVIVLSLHIVKFKFYLILSR